jgi:hypothetical protein
VVLFRLPSAKTPYDVCLEIRATVYKKACALSREFRSEFLSGFSGFVGFE